MFQSIKIVSTKGPADVLVLGQWKGVSLDKASAALDPSGTALAASKRIEATGEAGVVLEAFPDSKPSSKIGFTRVFVVGLGDKPVGKAEFDSGVMRTVAAAVGRKASGVKAQSLHVAISPALEGVKADEARCGNNFGEALGLLGWVCDEFRGKATTKQDRRPLAVRFESEAMAIGAARGLAIAHGANLCRTLSQTPPNIATPDYMADQAQKLARKVGLKCTVLRGQELAREKCEGLINVGKASENKPCLIRLEYTPKAGGGKSTGKPVVLVGKTMTYDTGGLSLKINNSMVGMKRDKDGGCAVLGAMHAIATTIKPRQRVIAYLVSAENSLSDEAYRPDDILTYRNGVTVEVTNTDAEGRLVLADALCIACEKDNPACIIDLATLTGGVITALGSTYCGMFCDDDKLRAKIEDAAKVSGERVWRLPLHQEYREMMKSPVADIVNSNPNRKAHAGQGAAFLSYFVKEGVPWCHLDIAGVHVAEKNAGMFVEGPTGWGVRILAEFLDQ